MDPEGGAEHGAGDQTGPVPADGTPRDAMLSDATPPGPEPLVAEQFAAEWSGTGQPGAEARRPADGWEAYADSDAGDPAASPGDLARADDDTQAIEPAPRPGLLSRAGAGLAVAARRVTGPG
ncbi:MAG TPA: hypothetical protein VK599_14720, partial [Streptosporangiaceae bacterium]|nr:hypothetical protein [Streptosporangiaceae bacterium]